jgi:hypothetical protein
MAWIVGFCLVGIGLVSGGLGVAALCWMVRDAVGGVG